MDKFHFLPIEQAAIPKGTIIYHWSNRWWVVHPEKGLAFYREGYSHPQCNSNEALTRRLCPEWGEVRFIETVFAPCNISDYQER